MPKNLTVMEFNFGSKCKPSVELLLMREPDAYVCKVLIGKQPFAFSLQISVSISTTRPSRVSWQRVIKEFNCRSVVVNFSF